MAQRKRENEWRKKLEGLAMSTWPNSEIIKMHIGAMDGAGLPDLYIASRGVGEVWLELKYVPPDEAFDFAKQPTPLQKERIRRLYYAGARVGLLVFFEEWWVSVHGKALIDLLQGGDAGDSGSTFWQARYLYPDGTVEQFRALVWGDT